MNKLTVMDIKQAIWDERFRALFPEFEKQFEAFFKKPGCGCNMNFIRNVMKHKDRLKQYFPTKDIELAEEKDAENDYIVINCQVDELADRLKKYTAGKRMVAVARFRDKVTVV